MRQQSLTDGFEKYRKKTRKEQFLEDMETIIPWQELVEVIEPYYPNPSGAGRRPVGVERMLRIYFLQHWFNLSDPAVEEALYDSRAMRRFVGIDLGRKPVQENGLKVSTGTIVDATIIDAPSSTKNKDKARDPDMHQTKKGNQWYFGMKAHIGVDSRSKLIHSVAATAANVHDSQLISDLLHGNETRVWGDSAHAGQGDAIREHAPNAKDFTHQKGSRHRPLSDEDKARNRTRSRVRAKAEHSFLILQRVFGFAKVRYRGLEKNATRLFVACGLVNLYMVRRRLLRAT